MPELIPYAQLQPTPWKNGGGITRQIALWPRQASLEAFQWRISTAEVAMEGAFSHFPDTDRTLIVATPGRSVHLSSPDWKQPRTLSYGAPFHFRGETAITATLPDGPLRDFNIMRRRGQAHAAVHIHDRPGILALDGQWRLLHCLGDRIRLHNPNRAGQEFLLATGDSLLWLPEESADPLTLDLEGNDTKLIDVRINAQNA